MGNKHNIETSPLLSDSPGMGWNFDNTYLSLGDEFFSVAPPTKSKNPALVLLNNELASDLDLSFSGVSSEYLASIFSGNHHLKGSEFISQAYAGHQFGHFSILGDGRATLVGEHVTKKNTRFDIQLKGAGKTPYSRQGDGRAGLGPVLREYIISEAMDSLNISTSRSLAVTSTGQKIYRESEHQGAILTRVSSSHIRVGTFEYLAAINNFDGLERLLNYTINRHFPELSSAENKALSVLGLVIDKQIDLVVEWMRVGFVHGVMNTDNVSVSGETIDYGPCAFMNSYNPKTVFSSIDLNGRYSFGNQPTVTYWNMIKFAESLLPIINPDPKKSALAAQKKLDCFSKKFSKKWGAMMLKKIGIQNNKEGDLGLLKKLLEIMDKEKLDYTNTFTDLYNINNQNLKNPSLFKWAQEWLSRVKKEYKNIEHAFELMKKTNPYIIPRNNKVEEVLLSAINHQDYSPLKKFLIYLKKPYEHKKGLEEYCSVPVGFDNKYKTFCGT
ncbi:MAG: hypothetical protein CFH19_00222 [Alphaproteobacteria bacterium MarineAlpha5_Bin9]|nr:MAG: hypothetical protein CFH19_00222 [Alphaproteobacteria bacterium MarineAlpha5_Bin9]|tara:strand:+ start:24542 stop:26035 length:1494 start_codon:yes stop_codon:yes gene_type:complete